MLLLESLVISSSRQANIAAFAALAASAGDLLMLYVVNAERSELALPELGRVWLWLGGVLGVVAIPLYALGYWAVSRVVAQASEPAGRIFFVSGAIGAVAGGVIHGLTAVHIDAQLDAGAAVGDPLASLMSAGPPLLGLWAAAAVSATLAAALFSWFVGRGATALPPSAALANPVLLTVALAGVGLPSIPLRSFLTPAAPNLAHVIFFFVCAHLLWRDG